eukprot:3065557-Alexandrium_andersonii.AAC.1
MSASLVGSEMCIRDSPRAHSGPAKSGWQYVCSVASAGPQLPRRARRKPVSYTHLTLPTICSV